MQTPMTTRAAASALAARGLPVFRLQWRSKEPLARSNGFYDATLDLSVVRRWWSGALYNVGIATGVIGVLDIDGDAGLASLHQLVREHGRLPETPIVRTSRGLHFYFRAPSLPCRIAMLPGVDWKGDGGYVVGPCSVHPSGAVYRFLDDAHWTMPFATAPEWLIDLVQQRPETAPTVTTPSIRWADRYADAAINGALADLKATTTDRNNKLNATAYRFGRFVAREFLSEDEAERLLTDAAAVIGLPPKEAMKTVRSGLRKGVSDAA